MTRGALRGAGFASAFALMAMAHGRAHADERAPSWAAAFGPGAQHFPAWLGSRDYRGSLVPYASFSWRDRVELSTLDGVSVDVIHSDRWHGGLYADYRWGRSRSDLGDLADRINTLPFAVYGGTYLEYAVSESVDIGLRVLRDVARPGAQAETYFSWDLPGPRWLNHSLEVVATAADATAQNRYFGIAPMWEERLEVSPYRAGGGWQQVALSYEVFLPTSTHTGVALSLEYARLAGAAVRSPLVRNFGAGDQRSAGLAFVYHIDGSGE